MKMRSKKSLGAAALLLGLVLAAAPATAQSAKKSALASSNQKGSVSGLSIWGILSSWGVGAGARFAVPLGSSGVFVKDLKIKDEFALEFGADLMVSAGFSYVYSWTSVIPKVGVMWVFWLQDGKLGLYPKLDLGYPIYLSRYGSPFSNPLALDGVFGAIYRVNNLSLRAEVGGGWYGGALKLGVALNF